MTPSHQHATIATIDATLGTVLSGRAGRRLVPRPDRAEFRIAGSEVGSGSANLDTLIHTVHRCGS